MESLTLTIPVTPALPTTTTYRIRSLYLGWEEQVIVVVLRDNNGALVTCTYEGSSAVTLMTALNKANLSTNSLHKRVLNHLASDAKLPGGAVTGSPD